MEKSVSAAPAKKRYPGRPAFRDRDVTGSRTLAAGLKVLQGFTQFEGPASVSDVARYTGMSVTRASRFLGTLAQAGFLQQDLSTGRFELGPATFGLAAFALGRIDGIRLAVDAMRRLTDATSFVSVLCVWGTNGPTVIRGERGTLDVAVRIREGVNLSTVATATGRIFLAHQDTADAQAVIDRDLAAWNARAPRGRRMKRGEVEGLRRQVRADGFAQAEGLRDPMLSAIAVPVFGSFGRLAMSLSLVGTRGAFLPGKDEAAAHLLKAAAKNLSAILGTVPG